MIVTRIGLLSKFAIASVPPMARLLSPKAHRGRGSWPRRRPLDTCADYNAFGCDLDGRLAFLAAFFWGPAYVPHYTVQQFGGPPGPPRFGPPAPYQRAYLPVGWEPRPPPNFYGLDLSHHSDYLDPPSGIFDPRIFAALQHIARFELRRRSGELLWTPPF